MSLVGWLAIAEVAWIVGVCTWIIFERRSPVATLAWVFGLAWLPYVGIMVYLLIGPRRLVRKKRRHAAARSRARQASYVKQGAAEPAVPRPAADDRLGQFMHLVERAGEGPPLRCDGLELLPTGDACFARIEQAIAAARHHVHLEYYLWDPDAIGGRWRDLLCDTARRGVQVRLLLDAIGSSNARRRFLAPLRQAGGEVAWFNPLRVARFRPGLFNFRTHRKIVVCDGTVGFTGGINVSASHSAAAMGAAAYRDTHLLIAGPPVGWLQSVFLEDWDFATGRDLTRSEYFPELPPAAGPWVQIIASGPDHDMYAIHKFYFAAIATARERVLVTTPYFVPDEAICSALMTASLRGVEVRVLVPKHTDSRLLTAAARSYYEELARVGVRIYECAPPMLHAKTLVVDNDIAVVGTANLDNRSLRLNFEVIAAVYDAQVARQLTTVLDAHLAQAEEYRLGRARTASLAKRLAESTARLFSPLL